MTFDLNDKIANEIASYCESNNIEISVFIEEIVKKGFMIEKYGNKPNIHPLESSKNSQANNTTFSGISIVVQDEEHNKQDEKDNTDCVNHKEKSDENDSKPTVKSRKLNVKR